MLEMFCTLRLRESFPSKDMTSATHFFFALEDFKAACNPERGEGKQGL